MKQKDTGTAEPFTSTLDCGTHESCYGREGSKYGLDDYLEVKYLCIGGIDA